MSEIAILVVAATPGGMQFSRVALMMICYTCNFTLPFR